MVAVMPSDDGDEQTPGILFITYRLAYTRAHALTLTLPHTLSHSHSRAPWDPLNFSVLSWDLQKAYVELI